MQGATAPPASMTTQTATPDQQMAAFNHLLCNLMDVEPTEPLYLLLVQKGYNANVMGLSTIDLHIARDWINIDPDGTQTKLPLVYLGKLKVWQSFVRYKRTMEPSAIPYITPEEYDDFFFDIYIQNPGSFPSLPTPAPFLSAPSLYDRDIGTVTGSQHSKLSLTATIYADEQGIGDNKLRTDGEPLFIKDTATSTASDGKPLFIKDNATSTTSLAKPIRSNNPDSTLELGVASLGSNPSGHTPDHCLASLCGEDFGLLLLPIQSSVSTFSLADEDGKSPYSKQTHTTHGECHSMGSRPI